jgi:hypothetical protein
MFSVCLCFLETKGRSAKAGCSYEAQAETWEASREEGAICQSTEHQKGYV